MCCNWSSSVQVYRKLQGYLILWFNKYPRNPQNFLSLKLISPTVLHMGFACAHMMHKVVTGFYHSYITCTQTCKNTYISIISHVQPKA